MTNERGSRRRWWWTFSGLALLAIGLIGRELIRSGTVGDEWMTHWYGKVAYALVGLLFATVGFHLMSRRHRNRADSDDPM